MTNDALRQIAARLDQAKAKVDMNSQVIERIAEYQPTFRRLTNNFRCGLVLRRPKVLGNSDRSFRSLPSE